jgi:hypothetical protein
VRICQGGVGIQDVSRTTPENRLDRAAPKVTQAFITSDRITDRRYEGVVLDQSRAAVSHCDFGYGNVAIQVRQYGANLLLIPKLDY